MTPRATSYANALESIITAIKADGGLTSRISARELADGIAAARSLNALLATVIDETGVNADGVISTADLMAVSDAVRADPARYNAFVEGHGDDEGNVETGFHLLQNDGGILRIVQKGDAFTDRYTCGDDVEGLPLYRAWQRQGDSRDWTIDLTAAPNIVCKP